MAATQLPPQLKPLEEVPGGCAAPREQVALLAAARHPDPSTLLGPQVVDGHVVLRCWVSGASEVAVASDAFLPFGGPDAREDPPSQVALHKSAACPEECGWLFEVAFEVPNAGGGGLAEAAEAFGRTWGYKVQVKYAAGGRADWSDPYGFGPLLPESVLRAWASGEPAEPPANTFGAHHMELQSHRPGLWGTRFAVWAPHAQAVSVVGDFNFWDGRAHPMCRRSDFGVWELFLPVWDLRGKKYGYQIVPPDGPPEVRTDPFALEFVEPVEGAHDAKVPAFDDFSRAAWGGAYAWTDAEWLKHRAVAFSEENWASQPLSIYEVHLSSWAAAMPDGKPLGYRELAEPLAKHVKEMGFSAVEFLPLSQYPCEQSWGYQCAAGLYAVDSRLGTPDDFRHLVDTLHRHYIAVFVDFVGAHFAKDTWGLVRYSGAPQFEYDGDLGELPGWGTARFNYGKPEVRSYLFGAAEHWIDSFHVDGLRLDAVAAMVYRSFGREEDGDAILAGRGSVNEDGVDFLRAFTARLRARRPGVLVSAEESTNFKWVTARPAEPGTERGNAAKLPDLGFHLKWNMGFTYDALAFLGTTFAERPRLDVFGWKKLAWYLAYAFNERWVLPLSHDNAHHRGLWEQMTAAGEDANRSLQFAHLRLLFTYLVGMPGRPLLFMGAELGEGAWSFQKPLDWAAAEGDTLRQQLKAWTAKLLHLYRELPALHRQDDDAEGFVWLDKDEVGRCCYAWRRRCSGAARDVIVAINASPRRIAGYRLPVGADGARRWRLAAASCADEGRGAASETDAVASAVAGGAGEFVDVPFRGSYFETEMPGCAARIWVADDPAPPAAGAARVRLELRHPGTSSRESVRIVGGCAALGQWRPEDAPKLTTSPEAFPLWGADIDLPLDAGHIEFKFVTVKADGTVTWEPIADNRRTNFAGDEAKRIVCEFGRM
mmetsp:Transcript_28912/g.83850  ORF Transcript_28912/g.83850 Transcript_28912/m.83850 type:complete len:936 (-) Transcript_28912:96-2903(-)